MNKVRLCDLSEGCHNKQDAAVASWIHDLIPPFHVIDSLQEKHVPI